MGKTMVKAWLFSVGLLIQAGILTAQTLDEGVLLLGQGKHAEAVQVLQQVLEKDENNAEAHFQLGCTLFSRANAQRDVDDAVDEFEKAVDLQSDNAEYQFRYGVALGEKVRNAGIIKQAFLAPKVKNAFLKAVTLKPNFAQARIGLAQFYLIAPAILGGDKEEGWKQLEEAIKLDPLSGRIVKAHLLAEGKNYDEADKEYNILVAAFPSDWRVWKAYGYFCMQKERCGEAIGHFQKYVELRPDTADSYQSLAEAFLKKGDTDQATLLLEKSLSLDKDFVPAIISMGEVYQKKGQNKEAKEAFQRALSLAQHPRYIKQAEEKLKEIE